MPRIFINPRREDASGHAGRLYDALAGRFGREQAFMDVDAIRPGENFATVVDDSVASCHFLIALIGRRWMSVADRDGRPRLERPEDYVRLELQTDQISVPGSPGGLAVLAGGPRFALTRRLASTVTASLTPADS